MSQEVLVTGAGSGIGEAIAKIFSEKGFKVYLLGRQIDKLKHVQGELKGKSEIIAFDLEKAKDYPALEQKLKDLGANISILINNAGIFSASPQASDSDENWQKHFDINVMGPVRLTRLLLPQIKKNKGCVTNVSSTLGLRPIMNTGAYSASKAALNSWCQTLAMEVAPDVRVNSICPGLIDTPIHAYHGSDHPEHIALKAKLQKLQPMARMGQPEDIAQAVYFVSSKEASWMTGSLVPVDGGVVLTTRDS